MATASVVEFYAERFKIPAKLALAQMERESSGNPLAINSRTGALGLMQVEPATMRDLLLDAEVNACAGLRYLQKLHAQYAGCEDLEAWKFALAAYDWGINNVTHLRISAAAAHKDPNVFANIASACPSETQRYVAGICAAAFAKVEEARVIIDPEISV